MPDATNMVLRTVYLPVDMDDALRSVSFYERCPKAGIMRHFIYGGLGSYFDNKQWRELKLAALLQLEEKGMRTFSGDLEVMRQSTKPR